MKTILAIDPGKSGGIAWMDGGGRIIADPMPDTPGGIIEYFRDVITSAGSPGDVVAFVEQVGGFIGKPHPGSAMFTFGCGFGFILAWISTERN